MGFYNLWQLMKIKEGKDFGVLNCRNFPINFN